MKEKYLESIFNEMIIKNCPKQQKDNNIQVQEGKGLLINLNPKKNPPRHIINKLSKIKQKERVLRQQEKKFLKA